MSFNHYVPGKTNPHLPHDGVEIQQIPASAEDIELAKSDADDLVRQLMNGNLTLPKTKGEFEAIKRPQTASESRTVSKPLSEHAAFRTAEPVGAEPAYKPVTQCATNDAILQKVLDAATEPTPVPAPEPAPPADSRPIEMREDELVKQVLKDAFPRLHDQDQIEPTSGWAKIKAKAEKAGDGMSRGVIIGAVAVAAVICVIWPLQVLLAGLLALTLFVASMQLMRVAIFARVFRWVWQRIVARSPERAERARRVADTVASAIEQVLDYMPGGMADRLALPDFSKPVTPKRG